ncbi:hypothetical protein PVK06_032189 [Gossypium arboreum]|uniref:Reverse transcriptase zinc-binding domain-containing protein n=1 Tax=Gossypium arboreum TaxID=29729 RepID=A0ABR0NT78_GOSAR|nr:hypothetical protein PVK06_032189 [Gossypium arboreum]
MNRLIWHFNRDGVYTVHSGYQLALSLNADIESLFLEGPWLKLWGCRVLPMVKHFLWRCLCHFIPTKERLLEKGVSIAVECVLLRARTAWQLARFQSAPTVVKDFIIFLLKLPHDRLQQRGITSLWSLWFHRNLLCWKGV